jgi:hypothetical protein
MIRPVVENVRLYKLVFQNTPLLKLKISPFRAETPICMFKWKERSWKQCLRGPEVVSHDPSLSIR